MPVYRLGARHLFPDPRDAESDGLLAVGGDLSVSRLLGAYASGIFPWYAEGEPLLWWSPPERALVLPGEERFSVRTRRALRHIGFEIRCDTRFEAVVQACATVPRPGQHGTWITAEMQAAYCTLHELGFAHSVETWVDETLVGGLYGLAIGRMFYGESMFSYATDASKIAIAHLTRFLEREGFGLIDCQMNTSHLASLGAREIPRCDFIARLQKLTAIPPLNGRWPEDGASISWA